MATLVLTTVGTLVGGPIGGAIGAIIGQQADRALFAPKPAQGPRLNELSVQTSSYGTAIPKIFGTMRVAGTVIWSTDLRETRSTSGGGKGRPKSVTYSYSASFAVALSARRIRSVERIWADGKLLRGADGRFKSGTRFRLYQGDKDQPVDPLIASVEGISRAPAFRGIAYALFEDLELEDFGSRIPLLTFELVAEPAPVALGAIVEEISDGAVMGGETPEMIGFAASGDTVRAALESVADVVPLSLAGEDEVLRIGSAGGDVQPVAQEDLVARPERVRRAPGALPSHVEIAYHDQARDYQTGLQRIGGGGSGRSDRRALPAVLTASSAKQIAQARLSTLRAGRERARIELVWRGCGYRPGSLLSLPDVAGRWKVERWTLAPVRVSLDLVRVPDLAASASTATPGRPIGHVRLPEVPSPYGGTIIDEEARAAIDQLRVALKTHGLTY